MKEKVENGYKIVYYKSTEDRITDTKTVLEGLTFEQAREWFYIQTGNKNGPVWFLHP